MINITLRSNSQAMLEGPELDIIREHFSVKNEAAHFQRRFGRFVLTGHTQLLNKVNLILDY